MDFRNITEFIRDSLKYVIVIVVVLFIAMYVVSFIQVIGPSMSPTLNEKDVLLVSKLHYKVFDVKRHDVISFNYAETKYLIKRVIGLPGEVIEYKDNILYINGEAFKETNITNKTSDFNLKKLGYDVIPEDMYVVLGDNRENSLDSREIGLVKKSDIMGKAFVRIWPFKLLK